MIFKKLSSNIIFWIIVFFLIRLIGITNPPLEVSHNWRQTTVTMVTRNFLEVDNNIFYPRIDIAGEKTGITGMEFPIFNYLIYIVSLLFGYEHWYGRLINLCFSSLGVYYFYQLVKLHFNKELAFRSSIILLGSLWFMFSRKVMPDTFAISFVFASLYHVSKYFDSTRLLDLVLFTILGLVGMLAKLPVGYLYILLIPLLIQHKLTSKSSVLVALGGGIILFPTAFWYFKWVPYLVEEFGFWHFYMGEDSLTKSIELIWQQRADFLHRFYQDAIMYIGFIFYLIGLFFLFIKNKNTKLKWVFILSSIGITVIILKAGFAFPHHNYYILPFVPVMALVSAHGISQIKNNRVISLLLLLICIENISGSFQDFRIKDSYYLELESALNQVSNPNDLIIINSGDVPTPMYFAHRKGWVKASNKITNDLAKTLQKEGAKHILYLRSKASLQQETLGTIVYRHPSFLISQLSK